MEYKIKSRINNKLYIEKEEKLNIFLYKTIVGRIILKILVLPFLSKLSGLYMNSKFSKRLIRNFIYKNNINMNEYEDVDYNCFNEFFTRKIKKDKRPINKTENVLISPCDGKLSVYNISDKNSFKIKNSTYKIEDLVPNINKEEFKNGHALIFRLSVDDYHRYSFIDDGKILENKMIKGKLHTVRPISQEKYKIYTLNQREYTKIKMKNFGNIIQIEVGALLVGKIVNHEKNNVKKGEEKGYFKFGASTVVLLINNIKIDDDILNNTKNDIETIVKLGEKIGIKVK